MRFTGKEGPPIGRYVDYKDEKFRHFEWRLEDILNDIYMSSLKPEDKKKIKNILKKKIV